MIAQLDLLARRPGPRKAPCAFPTYLIRVWPEGAGLYAAAGDNRAAGSDSWCLAGDETLNFVDREEFLMRAPLKTEVLVNLLAESSALLHPITLW